MRASSSGPGGQAGEKRVEEVEIGGIDQTVSGQVGEGPWPGGTDLARDATAVRVVDQAILVHVAVAGIAEAIEVAVLLARVRGLDAIVQSVEHAVTIDVLGRRRSNAQDTEREEENGKLAHCQMVGPSRRAGPCGRAKPSLLFLLAQKWRRPTTRLKTRLSARESRRS